MSQLLEGFPTGRFRCRFLAKQPSDPDALIDDPFWDEDDPPLRFRNIANMVRDLVRSEIDLQGAPFASWVLARLWYLSAGAVAFSLNVDAQGQGAADGGDYTASTVVEDAHGHGVAVLYLEGMTIYTDISLSARSAQVDPNEIIAALVATLREQPYDLAPCRIAIADHEQPGRVCEYGWDGQRFLGKAEVF